MELIPILGVSIKLFIWLAIILAVFALLPASNRSQANLPRALSLLSLALTTLCVCWRELLTPPSMVHLVWLWSRIYGSGLVIAIMMVWLSAKEVNQALTDSSD